MFIGDTFPLNLFIPLPKTPMTLRGHKKVENIAEVDQARLSLPTSYQLFKNMALDWNYDAPDFSNKLTTHVGIAILTTLSYLW